MHQLLAFVLFVALSSPLLSSASEGTISVVLGKPFTLKKGERAQVVGFPVVVEIEGFSNSPCPKGAQCAWSGLAVHLKITVNGKPCTSVQPRSKDCRYEIEPGDSDYTTQATMVMRDMIADCETRAPDHKQGCLRDLSVQFSDEGFCGKLRDVMMRDGCYEDLAELPGRAALCSLTVAPRQYCLYAQLLATNGLARCDEIIKFSWCARCYKEIVAKSGRGAELCNTLKGDLPAKCKEYLAGRDH